MKIIFETIVLFIISLNIGFGTLCVGLKFCDMVENYFLKLSVFALYVFLTINCFRFINLKGKED